MFQWQLSYLKAGQRNPISLHTSLPLQELGFSILKHKLWLKAVSGFFCSLDFHVLPTSMDGGNLFINAKTGIYMTPRSTILRKMPGIMRLPIKSWQLASWKHKEKSCTLSFSLKLFYFGVRNPRRKKRAKCPQKTLVSCNIIKLPALLPQREVAFEDAVHQAIHQSAKVLETSWQSQELQAENSACKMWMIEMHQF